MKNSFTKISCILLAMILFSLMAIGSGSSDKESSTTANVPGTTRAASQTTAPATTKAPETTKAPKASYTINNQIIVDNDKCVFTIVKAEVDPIWGFTLKTLCENKTADTTLMFAIDDVSINGYMASALFAEEVAPGKKSNEDASFSSSIFDDIGISSADEVAFKLRIYDSKDWSAPNIVNETFTVYPTGMTTADVKVPERRTASGETVIVDNDDLTFVILDTEDDPIWGYTVNCYIENKTDKTVMVTWNEVSVNGFMIDPFWAQSISPGKRSYGGISFSKTKFEESSITSVSEIEYTLRVYNAENLMDDDIYKKTLKYTP